MEAFAQMAVLGKRCYIVETDGRNYTDNYRADALLSSVAKLSNVAVLTKAELLAKIKAGEV